MAQEIRQALAERGVEVVTIQCRNANLPTYAAQADLVVTTAPAPASLGIPVITTLAFLTGIGTDRVIEEIIGYLGANPKKVEDA
jgi:PTS system galactitol-specific IIB component